MKPKIQGFTLLEMILVIVILGILSASVVPKFLDIKDNASQVTVNQAAAALSIWGGQNLNVRKIRSPASANNLMGEYDISNNEDGCIGGSNNAYTVVTAVIWSNTTTNKAPVVPGLQLDLNSAYLEASGREVYKITSAGSNACVAGLVLKCTLTHRSGKTATAYIPCTN